MKREVLLLLVGIGIAAVLFGGGYLTGRKTCPQVVKPIAAAQIPEAKPAQTKEKPPPKPVIKWKTVPALDEGALKEAERVAYWKGVDAGFQKGWDSCAQAHHAYLKPERFTVTDTVPHTKDSVTYFPLADSFSVVHMGIMPTVLVGGESESGRRRRHLLHVGLNFWFGQDAQFWGTIPVPRDRKAFYFPHRAGVTYQPKGKEAKLTLEWEAL